MSLTLLKSALVLLLAALAPLAVGQPTAGVSGHWEGAIHIPNTDDLAIQVDLAKDVKGEWQGAIDIPTQNLRSFPLSNVSVKGNSVAFVMKTPGDPSFNGTLSSDGKSMSGDFSQGGGSTSFDLKRTGDARLEAPAKSTLITKELEGTWEGVLDINGKRYRLVLRMANQPDGAAGGSILSLDQNDVELPITSITQKDSHLKLEIKTIDASYSGDLKQGALDGQWTQRGATFSLTFKRPAAEDKK